MTKRTDFVSSGSARSTGECYSGDMNLRRVEEEMQEGKADT